jgi:predicted DNA-binding transcriptional regulator
MTKQENRPAKPAGKPAKPNPAEKSTKPAGKPPKAAALKPSAKGAAVKPSAKEPVPPAPIERTEEELVDLTSRVYKLVVEHGRDGVLQSEIWKELRLTSRDGSRLAIRLERRGLIGRVKVLEEGRWTYKLTPLRFPTDMASIEKAPCIVCYLEPKCSKDGEISPFTCKLIAAWVVEEAAASHPQAAPAASIVQG